jgi:hypothetical protein
VRFWDASAIVPLIVHEPTTAETKAMLAADAEMSVWWGTEIECASAVARRAPDASKAETRLEALKDSWQEVEPSDSMRETARRAARVHRLRAGDAFQLAAALLAAEGDPRTLPFVTLDDELAQAATLEGFPVVRPAC